MIVDSESGILEICLNEKLFYFLSLFDFVSRIFNKYSFISNYESLSNKFYYFFYYFNLINNIFCQRPYFYLKCLTLTHFFNNLRFNCAKQYCILPVTCKQDNHHIEITFCSIKITNCNNCKIINIILSTLLLVKGRPQGHPIT